MELVKMVCLFQKILYRLNFQDTVQVVPSNTNKQTQIYEINEAIEAYKKIK